MGKRKNPETSLEAWKSVTSEQLASHHNKILLALKKLKRGNAEQISSFTSLNYWQVSRRISKLVAKQLIYRTGKKIKTRTGRDSYVYSIVKGKSQEKKFIQKELFY